MHETARKALKKAINNFFTQEQILSEEYLREKAADFVYEHNEEILERIRDEIDTDDIFISALDAIDWNYVW